MDESLARIVAVAAWRSTRELGDLVPLLKEHCSEEVYGDLLLGVAKALAEISTEVLNPVYAMHPQLEQEFERSVTRYGRTS